MSTEAEPAADGNNSAQATDKPVKQASTTDASAPKKGSNYSGDNNSEAVNSNDNEATATEKESIVAKLNSDRGISAELANLLAELVVSPNKIFSLDDFDERATNAVKDLDAEFLRSVVDELLVKDYTNISNKSACLCGLVKQMKLKRQQQQLGDPADADRRGSAASSGAPSTSGASATGAAAGAAAASGATPSKLGPDEAKLKELLAEIKFCHEVTVGQRRLGPPIGAEELKDSSQCEIFVGKLPKDMYEDRIYQMFRPVGPIYDIRVMVDPPTGMGRGFCFVCYTSKQDASKAVEKFHEYEIKPQRRLQVNLATPNLRLFVGNIPKTLDRAKLMDDFSRVLDGVVDVIVYGSADDPRKKNRGFCFLEFDKHSSASAARRKLMKYPRVWSSDVWVDWADPLDEPDPDVMAKVRVLYVKSLTMDVTEDKLQEAFSVYGPLNASRKSKTTALCTSKNAKTPSEPWRSWTAPALAIAARSASPWPSPCPSEPSSARRNGECETPACRQCHRLRLPPTRTIILRLPTSQGSIPNTSPSTIPDIMASRQLALRGPQAEATGPAPTPTISSSSNRPTLPPAHPVIRAPGLYLVTSSCTISICQLCLISLPILISWLPHRHRRRLRSSSNNRRSLLR
ncbi:hypothetical protein BOX15_Mlig006545g3 [Macrostomum lignano]|uniref:RRM domain-containing protein n=1 Tax=Macrostomum lignano TaxID=282301 RepID=A0A267EZJ4_9PLAT|nr:hypothetical protein BOX15_Mlig006545g3 [Macrostomum lignano]